MGACSSRLTIQDQIDTSSSQLPTTQYEKKQEQEQPTPQTQPTPGRQNSKQEVKVEGSTQYFDAIQSLSRMTAATSQVQDIDEREDKDKDEEQVAASSNTHTDTADVSTIMGSSSSTQPSLEETLRHNDFMSSKNVEIKRDNYPGVLTERQISTCLEFKTRLENHPEPALKEIVYCFVPVEGEAFALCRFLRARKFDIDETIKMIEANVDVWKTRPEFTKSTDFLGAKEGLEHTMGCPLPILDHEITILDDAGIAKNGAYVSYWQPGRIDLEGSIECIESTVAEYTPYVWYVLINAFRDAMERIKDKDNGSTTVLAESIFVIDLQNLPRSIFSNDVMSFLKVAFSILNCFPEVLNRMVIVNVPRYFTMIWAVLKVFVDPRTVQKIGFFSSTTQAKKDILQYINEDQLLSDYGGTSISFDEALERQLKRHGVYSRYIIERVNTSGKKKNYRLPVIELKDGESADVTVYTQSRTGAVVSWSRRQSSSPAHERLVQNTRGLSSSKSAGDSDSENSHGVVDHHRHNDLIDIPQCTAVIWDVSQEGQYECFVSPVLKDQPEHFLVVVSIR